MDQINTIKRVSKTTAVQKALENIREYIRSTESEVLPNEDELSQYLGVSRLTLREAITVLEREGVVSRVQGKGTLINSFVTKLENRIDCGSDIEGCLRQNGYDVRFEVDGLEFRSPTKIEENKLEIDSDDNILVVKKILYANDMVAAVYIDRVPEKLLKTKDFTAEDLRPHIFPIIENLCQKSITHDVVQLYPYGADEYLAKLFDIEINTPILKFDVLEYTSDSIALMYNTEFYTDKFIKFTICRNVAYKE